jgi:WD40 repeat protein
MHRSRAHTASAHPSPAPFAPSPQSETYVLKQAGHSYGLNSLAFSPNGALCATGGEDGKVSPF